MDGVREATWVDLKLAGDLKYWFLRRYLTILYIFFYISMFVVSVIIGITELNFLCGIFIF